MITFTIILIIISIISIVRDWEGGIAFVLSIIITLFIAIVYYSSVSLKPDALVRDRVELYSIKNFSNTSGYYIGTDSDYISYVKKDDGFVKFRMPEDSVIKENPELTTVGYYEYTRCIPGERIDLAWIFGVKQGLSCFMNYKLDPIITVPPNTVMLNFKI